MCVQGCLCETGGTDIVCDLKRDCIWCLFRHMHPKEEENVSVVSYIKHEALNNSERASSSPSRIVH